MKDKLFFFDFDQTLFSHMRKAVSSASKAALQKLKRQGCKIVVATGRGPQSCEFIKNQVGVDLDAMIFLNGQIVEIDNAVVYEKFIDCPSLYSIILKAKRRKIAYGGYIESGEVVSGENRRVQTVWKDFNCPVPRILTDFEQSHQIYQGQLYATQKEAELYFKQELKDYVINWSHKFLLNLISKDSGKSQGMFYLYRRFHISKEHVYAFGDGFNDEDMLREAGHGVAMGNSDERLKNAAEYVTDTVDEEGVVKALSNYGLI